MYRAPRLTQLAIVVALIATATLGLNQSRGQSTTTATTSLQDLQRSIGKAIDSEEVVRMIKTFPQINLPTDLSLAGFVSDQDRGIELRFFGSPRKLEVVHLHIAEGDGFKPYRGELPFCLSRDDRRREVEKRIGPPARSLSNAGYFAMYDDIGLFIRYVRSSGRDPTNPINIIGIAAPPEPNVARASRPKLTSPRIAFRLVDDADGSTAELLADPADATGRKQMPVLPEVLIDETMIDEVTVVTPPGKPDQPPAVRLKMTQSGAKRLREVTRNNLNRRLAIVLDGQVLIAPTIRSEVDRSVEISLTHNATDEEFGEVLARLDAAVNSLRLESATTQSAR